MTLYTVNARIDVAVEVSLECEIDTPDGADKRITSWSFDQGEVADAVRSVIREMDESGDLMDLLYERHGRRLAVHAASKP